MVFLFSCKVTGTRFCRTVFYQYFKAISHKFSMIKGNVGIWLVMPHVYVSIRRFSNVLLHCLFSKCHQYNVGVGWIGVVWLLTMNKITAMFGLSLLTAFVYESL